MLIMFRGVKSHRSAKTSTCKNPGLEAELVEKMKAEPENPEVVMRLLTHLQCDGPPRGRIVEALNLCLRRRTDWRWSADWQTAVLECCTNYQVRKCNNGTVGFQPVSLRLTNGMDGNIVAYFLFPLCFFITLMSVVHALLLYLPRISSSLGSSAVRSSTVSSWPAWTDW